MNTHSAILTLTAQCDTPLRCGLAFVAVLACLVGCRRAAPPQAAWNAEPPLQSKQREAETTDAAAKTTTVCPILLQDVTGETGIEFRHTDGSSGRRYIVEAMSTGIATFDYDGDGWIDIYFPNGAPLPGAEQKPAPRHALYRNLGGWRFQDVTDQVGMHCTAYGMGVTVGDYDNDGFPDVYLNNFGLNILFHNNGDGTFQQATERAGVSRGELVGAGACFFDIESDGDLDLYVGNYIALNCADHVPRVIDGIPSYPSPQEYVPVPDTLFRNEGDGTFVDISKASGIAAYAGRSMGMICVDFDNDGDSDVFVCNDVQPNFLFQNDGKGNFREVAAASGVAFNGNGEVLANMAVDAGDYNNDGWIDFLTTNYEGQLPVLFQNLGGGLFDDVTARTNAGAGAYPHVNWGCGLVDLDQDGLRDIFIANGHTEDNIELRRPNTAYRARPIVLRNAGGRFVTLPDPCGAPPRKLAARGAAFDDLDNDGDLDVVLLASRETPLIMRNMQRESQPANHWLQLELHGVAANRDGVGARVAVVAERLTQVDEVHSGRGYQSHSGSRLHFGLGPHAYVERLEIRWNCGVTQIVQDVKTDRLVRIVQTSGESR